MKAHLSFQSTLKDISVSLSKWTRESIILQRTIIQEFENFFASLERIDQQRKKFILLSVFSYSFFAVLAIVLGVFVSYALFSLIALSGLGYLFQWLTKKKRLEYENLEPDSKITGLFTLNYPIFSYFLPDNELFLYDGGGLLPFVEISIPFFKDYQKIEEALYEHQQSDEFMQLYLEGDQLALYNWIKDNPSLKDKLSQHDIDAIWEYLYNKIKKSTDRSNQVHQVFELPIIQRESSVYNDILRISPFLTKETVNPDEEFDILNSCLTEYSINKIELWNNEIKEMYRSIQGEPIVHTLRNTVGRINRETANILEMLGGDLKEIVSSTVPIDNTLFSDFHYIRLCPVCGEKRIAIERNTSDFETWINNKVLGGVLEDIDLQNPAPEAKDKIDTMRYELQEFIKKTIPISKEIIPYINADLTLMELGMDGRYYCPKCSNSSEYLEIIDAYIPLAHAYEVRMYESQDMMLENARAIIQNIASIVNTKNNRMTNLAPLQVELEESKSEYLKIAAERKKASEMNKLLRNLTKESEKAMKELETVRRKVEKIRSRVS
ncbi:MAG: hypothetical protein ACTSRR_11475 [Candidatus Heimdallarchaeaceae archaeon]